MALHLAPALRWNQSFLKMFKQRSYQKELLDEPDIEKGLLFQNLKELAIINKYAKGTCKDFPGIDFYCDDFRNVFSEINDIAIVHASLFCHHFTEEEITGFIKFCNKNKTVFIINDLERNPVAYYAIKLITRLFSKSPLVKMMRHYL